MQIRSSDLVYFELADDQISQRAISFLNLNIKHVLLVSDDNFHFNYFAIHFNHFKRNQKKYK